MITTTIDTEAIGSMISLKSSELTGLHVYHSTHSAVQADGNSQLTVVGEIHTTIVLENGLILPLDEVVVTTLKVGLIVDMYFMAEYKAVIDIPESRWLFPGDHIVTFINSNEKNEKFGSI